MNWPEAAVACASILSFPLALYAMSKFIAPPAIREADKQAASAQRIKEEKYTWQSCPVLECRIKTPHSHTQAFLDRLRGK